MAEMAHVRDGVRYASVVLVPEKKFAHVLVGQTVGLAETAYDAVERLVWQCYGEGVANHRELFMSVFAYIMQICIMYACGTPISGLRP